MKKFIAVITLLLAFSVHVNGQDKVELTSTEKGTKEAAMLTDFLGLNETQNADFARLFIQKHTVLEEPTITPESRKELSKIMEAKISASIDAEQFKRLVQNAELFKKLIH